MQLPIILAHGALGSADELIYLGIALIFIVIMAISWLRSRDSTLEDEPAEETREAQDLPERFELD